MEKLYRLRMQIRDFDKMKNANNFELLGSTLNNDRVFEISDLYRRIYKERIEVQFNPVDSLWPKMRELILNLENAVSLVNFFFNNFPMVLSSGDLEEPSKNKFTSKLKKLSDWIEIYSEKLTNKLQAGICLLLINDLITDIVIPSKEPNHGDIVTTEFFALSVYQINQQPERRDPFDIFISYRHDPYSTIADELETSLKRKGISCWIDQKMLNIKEGDRVHNKVIKKELKLALQSSACTVFLETVNKAWVGENFRGDHLAFSWQAFEERHSNNIILVLPPQSSVEVNELLKFNYGSIENLATIIHAHYKSARNRNYMKRRFKQGELQENTGNVKSMADKYFERTTHVTQRAMIILLTPEGIELNPFEGTKTDEDIFMNLVRWSPYCALQLRNAGIDLYNLFRAGSKKHMSNWCPPSSSLFGNVFGYEEMVSSEKIYAKETGMIEEVNLLMGLVERATNMNSDLKNLFLRTYKLTADANNGTGPGNISTLLNTLKQSLDIRREQFTDICCVLYRENINWKLRLFSSVGFYKIKDFDEIGMEYVFVNAIQQQIFIDNSWIEEIESALNKSDEALLNECFNKHDELKYLFFSEDKISKPKLIYTQAAEDWKIFLEPLELSEQENHSYTLKPSGKSYGEQFLELVTLFKKTERNQGGVATNVRSRVEAGFLQKRNAIVIGNSCSYSRKDSATEINQFELVSSVLSPLEKYIEILSLGYDDF